MARHSKWHNIKLRKGAQDKIRGKVFTIHSKLISLAAQRGGDPNKNPALYEAIANAKKANVPADNIERAIRKGTGEDKSAETILEAFYEGYAPGGVGIIVRALTDNRSRTAPNMRHAFSKHGGNLAETGALSSYAFAYRGVCAFPTEGFDPAKIEEDIIESGAEDYVLEEDHARVFTDRTDLVGVAKALAAAGYRDVESGFEYVPANHVEVDDFDNAVKILKIVDMLEEDEDVEAVWSNYSMSDDLLERAAEAAAFQPFRT